MWQRIAAWRRARILHRNAIDDVLWQRVVGELAILDRLTDAELSQLRDLATLFLHQKTFVGAHGLEVNDYMRVVVAAQACLPILNLGLDYYRGWYTVILYPDSFVAHREVVEDETGVVHTGYEELDGESAEGGPVVLAWHEARPQPDAEAYNVVLHEFAHKLDEFNGGANGLPPLHADMSVAKWSGVMNAAFEAFNAAIDRGEEPPFDDYAGTDPAEFFAVISELFFTVPDTLLAEYPDVCMQLAAFYRQDPQKTKTQRGMS
jgi:Mlc titration factor MtfA (ptsG expression regulator)